MTHTFLPLTSFMNTAYLLLGSNLGNRESYLFKAIEMLSANAGKVQAKSSVYSTAPWGNTQQADFLNQAIRIEIPLSAQELLQKILHIEERLGRKRDQKWEARMIDIDILLFNAEIIQTPELTVPHPFLHERRFALIPLVDIAGDVMHPILNKSIKDLLTENTDALSVTPAIKS